jgi:carboxymethylenebutenolidase
MVLHPAPGINPQLQKMMGQIAAEGFVCAAPDLYYRWGRRMVFVPTPAAPASDQGRSVIEKLSDFGLAQDFRVTLNFLKALPTVRAERIGCLGYCLGGRLAFLAACLNADLCATVVCYGAGIVGDRLSPRRPVPLLDLANQIQGPVLSLSGDQDQNPSPGHIHQIAEALKGLGKPVEFEVYPGAGHAFFSEDNPPRYHAPSAQQGWPRKLAFLKHHLQDVPVSAN